jgi:phage baseplate assembly protein W
VTGGQVASEFLGVGWQFPPGVEHGQLALAHYEESIQQAIWVILGTAPGERVMRPDFGCGIHDLVFGVNSADTAGRVASQVRGALLQWEPRIDVRDTEVTTGGDGEVLLIRIEYQVRATNNVFNLVYPFYLAGSAG